VAQRWCTRILLSASMDAAFEQLVQRVVSVLPDGVADNVSMLTVAVMFAVWLCAHGRRCVAGSDVQGIAGAGEVLRHSAMPLSPSSRGGGVVVACDAASQTRVRQAAGAGAGVCAAGAVHGREGA
jgi:hypothetical protein